MKGLIFEMPKVTYLGTQPKRDPIKDTIRGQQKLLHLTDGQAAQLLGLSREAYNRRMNKVHTDDWSLGDIKLLWRKLGLPLDELRGCVRY